MTTRFVRDYDFLVIIIIHRDNRWNNRRSSIFKSVNLWYIFPSYIQANELTSRQSPGQDTSCFFLSQASDMNLR